MALPDAFKESPAHQHTESQLHQRVLGLSKMVEYREIYYSKLGPGFKAIDPTSGGTADAVTQYLNEMRCYHSRSVYRLEHWVTDAKSPGQPDVYVDSQDSFTTNDSQNSTTLIPSTSGGHNFDPDSPDYTVVFENDGLFCSGLSYKNGMSGYTPATTLSPTEFSYSEDSDSGLNYYINESWYYYQHTTRTITEGRSDEMDYVGELTAMLDQFGDMDYQMELCWSTAANGSGYLNYAVSFDRWTQSSYPVIQPWYEDQSNPSLDLGAITFTATGAMSVNETRFSTVGMQTRTFIESPFSIVVNGNNPPVISGRRLQWRANVPMDYCVLEFFTCFKDIGGRELCKIRVASAHVDAFQIVEMPTPSITGFGATDYSEGKYLESSCNLKVYFGKTAAQVLAELVALGQNYVTA